MWFTMAASCSVVLPWIVTRSRCMLPADQQKGRPAALSAAVLVMDQSSTGPVLHLAGVQKESTVMSREGRRILSRDPAGHMGYTLQ